MVSALLFIVLCLTPASRAADGPTIQGWLRSEDGMPVSGGVYVWQRNPPCYQNHPYGGWHCDPPRTYWAVADAEGRFETGVLVPDDYYLSLSAGTGLLGSNWMGVGTVSVRDGKSVRDLVFTLPRAAELIVRVNDPLGLLPAQGTQPWGWGNPLIIGVDAYRGGYQGASTGPRDAAGGFDYRVNIPYGQPLMLWVFTRNLRVTDESGNALNTEGPNTVFTVPPFTCTKRFVLNVSPR